MSGEFDHLLEPAGEFDNLLPSETVEQKQPDNLVTRIQKFGYSGLSDADKKVFDEQYKTSVKANQAKMSLRQVQAFADANKDAPDQYIQNADNISVAPSLPSVQNMENDPITDNRTAFEKRGGDPIGNMPSDMYQAVRDALSVPAGVVTGTWNRFVGPKGNIGSERDITKDIDSAITQGAEGQGAEGVMADPLNLTMVIPGLGEAVMATKLGKIAQKAGPVIGESLLRGAAGAGEGAGYGALSLLDDTKHNTVGKAIGHSAAFGGGLGVGTGIFKGLGKDWFPGLSSQSNRAVDPATKKLVEQNLDQILGSGVFPKSKEGFYDLTDRERDLLGKHYTKAIKAVNPSTSWEDVVDDIRNNIRSRPEFSLLTEDVAMKGAARTQFENPLLASQNKMPFMRNIADIKEKLKSGYEKRLAKRYAVTGPGMKMLDKDIESVIRSKAIDNPELPIYTADELGWIRTAKTNPETYKDPIAENALAKKDLGRTWRDVVNAELESDPRYAAHVTDKVKKDYRLWSALEDVLDAPGRLGLTDRLPGGLSLSPYLKSSLAYKLGQGLVIPQKLRFGTRDSD